MCDVGQRYTHHLIRCYTASSMLLHSGDSEDRFGAWSTEGCREVVKEGKRRVCKCSQLAHFRILFVSLVTCHYTFVIICYLFRT